MNERTISEPSENGETTVILDQTDPSNIQDPTINDLTENCIDSQDMNCAEIGTPQAEYWPVILSAAALVVTVILFIIINLLGRKKR